MLPKMPKSIPLYLSLFGFMFVVETTFSLTADVRAGSRINENQNQISYPFNMVQRAQRILTTLDYKPGPDDGIWGPNTSNAVKNFQHDKGLLDTGELSMETRKLLFNAN